MEFAPTRTALYFSPIIYC